ncbi:MAG: PIN domain-containing protein [Candidatus Diapherotrites archaeon]|nr:PIN domain-containing protein [Candidatus Diapherotrites archaeon]
MNALIDTNILFYALDNSDSRKHKIAKELVKKGFKENAYISTQNVSEFYYLCKRKLTMEQLENAKLVALAVLKSSNWIKISYSENTVWNVIQKDNPKHDFWDLLIYFTMLEQGVTKIFTENEKDFNQFSGIEVINPFK